MLMDIACPAELMRVEQAIFGGGRRQAYFTFLNESAQVIASVTGLCALRDEQGKTILKTRLTFRELDGRPGRPFTCHLALDEYPKFKEADMLLETVLFDGGETWEMNRSRLVDCTPPPLEDGPDRFALIAQAGPDAICFPEKRDMIWICVCGRFNRQRWLSCRRCSRFRDEVLHELNPEAVLARQADHMTQARERDLALRRENAARQAAQRQHTGAAPHRAQSTTPARHHPKQKNLATLRVMSLLLIIALAIIGVGWFLQREFAKNINYPSITPSYTMPPVDYLKPLS